jgi:hypothetical protein
VTDGPPQQNDELARAWASELVASGAASHLRDGVACEVPFAARMVARVFSTRWNVGRAQPRSIADLGPADVTDILLDELPRRAGALNPDAFVDAAVELLIWAAKSNRILDRDVEYECRRLRAAAKEAMLDERKWSPGKQIAMAAIRDGVDPADLKALRDHALRRGLDPRFVDELLPPPPISLGGGRSVWLAP